MHPEGNPNPEISKEQRIENIIRPLRQLAATESFRFLGDKRETPYYVTVQWSEPRDNDVGKGWQQFTGTGRLNADFLTWAENHYRHWIDRGHVPLKVIKVEYLTNNTPKELTW